MRYVRVTCVTMAILILSEDSNKEVTIVIIMANASTCNVSNGI